MSVIQIVIVLLVLGIAWWLFSSYVLPHVPEPFRTIIIVVLALAACLWLLSVAGVLGGNLDRPLWRRGAVLELAPPVAAALASRRLPSIAAALPALPSVSAAGAGA